MKQDSQNTPAEKYLFIRVLKWASDRGSAGFKIDQLKDACANDEEEWLWIKRFMMGEISGESPIIAHLGGHHKGDGEYLYFLTASGASAYIDYLELSDARKNASEAMKWAIASLLLAAIVGAVQIYEGWGQGTRVQSLHHEEHHIFRGVSNW